MEAMGRRIGVKSEVAWSDPNVRVDGAPGDAFVESPEYKRIQDPTARSSRWSSGPVETGYPARTKATILEGVLDDPEAGTPVVPVDTRPGVVPTLFERLTVADAIPSSPTSSNVVRTVTESVATNAAEVVPEAGQKPESTLEFDEVDVPIKKIATWIPLSDESWRTRPRCVVT